MHGRAMLCAVAVTGVGLAVLSSAPALAQEPARSPDGLWQRVDPALLPPARQRSDLVGPHTIVQLDRAALDQRLALAPPDSAQNRADTGVAVVLSLPLPDGRFSRFRIEESPILAPELAAAFPQFRTYRGVGLDDPTATARLDVTDNGLHAQVLAAGGTVYVDPVTPGERQLHVAFDKSSRSRTPEWSDEVLEAADSLALPRTLNQFPISHGTTLRTYRLALAATGEYTAAAGGTKAAALSRMTTTMNRVNGILEREIAVRLTVATGNPADPTVLIYTDAATDPYQNSSGSTMLGQNQSTLDSLIGSANYDMGHVFSTGGGGVAYLRAVCNSALKAQGVTGLPNPVGDTFAVDYVSHEMGHQFGANHTFNSSSGACGANRSLAHAFEVGSGVTIMSYSGLCAPENIGWDSVDRYELESLNEMTAFITSGGGATCGTTTVTGNRVPVVTGPGASFSIPARTPFALTAGATDADGDVVTYTWEQHDRNDLSPANAWGTDDGLSPLFRSYAPSSAGTRYFPSLPYILNNANVPPVSTACSGTTCITGEMLPTTTRNLTFVVTVRDNHAGGGAIATQQTTIAVAAGTGPFAVTAPQGGESWPANSLQTVTWTVNGSNALAPNVAIVLSTDGGNTFPFTLLASTPNDGLETVTMPASTGTSARIKVQAVGNVFFDVSNANFTIAAAGPPPGAFSKGAPANGASGSASAPTLTWTASSTATSYEYCVDTSNNGTCDTGWVTTSSPSAQPLSGLAPSTTYAWQVRARSGFGATLADGGSWWTFTTGGVSNPLGDVMVDFGASLGLWAYYDGGGSPAWQLKHGLSPSRLATGDYDGNGRADVFVNFPGFGLWVLLNDSAWTPLHPFDAGQIVTGDINGNGRADVVVTFAGYGTWLLYDSGSWTQLHPLAASAIAVGNIDSGPGGRADVILSFGGAGTWAWYNNATWQQLHALPGTRLTIGDVDGNGTGDLVVQFTGHGQYVLFNNTTWVHLHTFQALDVVVANIDGDGGGRADIVFNFPGAGLYVFLNNATWVPLHGLNPAVMAAGDIDGNGAADLILDFRGYGLYIYRNNSTWTGIHNMPTEALASGRLNAN